jgi:hypothetical protein
MAVWDSAEQRTWSPHSHPRVAEAVSALDVWLRRRQKVFEYTRDPACVFRLDITRSPRSLVLKDGTRIRRGQRIGRLHFWNEQIPPVPRGGATIGWARQMQRAMASSLRELAGYLASRPDLGDVAAVYAEAPSGTEAQREQLARIMARYGFEAVVESERLTIGDRLRRVGENILISLFVFAHNPGALRSDTLQRVRLAIYLPRRVLEREFSCLGGSASGV